MATTTVVHYGVHWAPGKIAFLHQGRAGGNNAIGAQVFSPYTVRTRGYRWSCNHLIPLNAVNSARSHLVVFENLGAVRKYVNRKA